MDEILEELEHQEFLNECRALIEEIQWALLNVNDFSQLKILWDEVAEYGDEPAFTSVLFDHMIEEAAL